MEVVYFVLGMAVIIQVLAIMIVYTLKTKIEKLEIELQYLERGSQNVSNDLYRKIEDEVRELQFHNNQTLLRIEKELCELQNIINKNEKDIMSLVDYSDNFSSKSKKEKNLLKG